MNTTEPSARIYELPADALQRRFDLGYHVPYLQFADKRVGRRDMRVLEVGGRLPAELVIDTLGAARWVGIEETGYWDRVPDDGHGSKHGTPTRDRHMHVLARCPGLEALRPRDVLEGAVEDLPAALENRFERIFCIACPRPWTPCTGHSCPRARCSRCSRRSGRRTTGTTCRR